MHLIRWLFLFPLPSPQQASAKMKGTHESYATTVLLPVDLLAMLPACISTARGGSEIPLSYLLPCTTQYMGDKGAQGDYNEESAFLERNTLTYFRTPAGGRYVPHPKRASSSLLIILGACGDFVFSSEHLCFHQVNPMKGPKTVTCTPLPRTEKETEHGRTQRLVYSAEDVPEEEQDKSKLPPLQPGAVITGGSTECYPSQP